MEIFLHTKKLLRIILPFSEMFLFLFVGWMKRELGSKVFTEKLCSIYFSGCNLNHFIFKILQDCSHMLLWLQRRILWPTHFDFKKYSYILCEYFLDRTFADQIKIPKSLPILQWLVNTAASTDINIYMCQGWHSKYLFRPE